MQKFFKIASQIVKPVILFRAFIGQVLSSFHEVLQYGYVEGNAKGDLAAARVQIMVTGDIITSYAVPGEKKLNLEEKLQLINSDELLSENLSTTLSGLKVKLRSLTYLPRIVALSAGVVMVYYSYYQLQDFATDIYVIDNPYKKSSYIKFLYGVSGNIFTLILLRYPWLSVKLLNWTLIGLKWAFGWLFFNRKR